MTVDELREWFDGTAGDLLVEAEVIDDAGPSMRKLVPVTKATVLTTTEGQIVRLSTLGT